MSTDDLAVRQVLETVLYCEDLVAAEAFYTDVLGLQVLFREAGRHVFFRMEGGVFLLFRAEHTSRVQTKVGGSPIPRHGTRGEGHVAFSMEHGDVDRWRSRLGSAGIGIESEVEWPGGGRSLYFRDPGGNSVELATADLWF